MQLYVLRFAILIFVSFTEAFVKIDVSKLTSTTTAGKTETTTVTVPTTTILTSTDKPSAETVTTQSSPNTSSLIPTNIPSNSATNPEINVTRPSLDDHLPGTSRVKISPDHYYCSCDLKVNLCDVNCCCDNDCSEDMLTVFVCNEQHSSIYDFEYNGGLKSCEIKNEIFCVVGEDTTTSMKEIFDIKLLPERTKYQWPVAFDMDWSKNENRETYKVGDSLLTYNEKTEEITMFEIPYSLTGDHCHINIPVKFLDNHESKCLRTYDQTRTFLEEFQIKLKSIKILKSRRGNHALIMEHCTDLHSHCLEIQLFSCFNSISRSNCFNFNSTEIDENWINKEIILQFRHNFTNILNCTAFMIYAYTDITPVNTMIVHSIKIQFLQLNESMNGIHTVSGNIGYLQGKPVITAKFIPFNVSGDDGGDTQMILDYFHPNKTFINDEHFMKIPTIMGSLCVLDNTTYNTINFGENSYLTCDVLFDENINVTVDSNFTEICWLLQRKIFSFLINDPNQPRNDTNFIQLKIKISEFGNPKNISDHWINIDLKHGILEPIQSKFDRDENSNEFICQNMILNIHTEFMYASLRVGSFEHQNLIKKIDLMFGTRVDLKFNLNESIKVPIFADVMFIDLTSTVSHAASWNCFFLVSIGLLNVGIRLMD